MKLVTLKQFPFANASSVINLDTYTQIGNNIQFKAGKFSYSLNLGKDIREFVPATDSSLPIALLPKSIGDVTSDVGSYSLMAYLFYKGYKQGKGIGYYVGYGILGWMGGGILGRMAGNFFAKKYSDAGEVKSPASSTKSEVALPSPSVVESKGKVDLSDADYAKLSALSKSFGNNINANDIKSKVNEMSKSYSPMEKEFASVYFKTIAGVDAQILKANPMQFFEKLEKSFAPLNKKYGEEAISKAAAKVNSDYDKSFPKNPFMPSK